VSVSLYIQHAERIRSIVLTRVAYQAVNIFFTLSHERHDFREKVFEHKICALSFFKLLCKTFFIPRRIEWDIVIKVYRAPCKLSVILVRI
jgi:hypothetical protein